MRIAVSPISVEALFGCYERAVGSDECPAFVGAVPVVTVILTWIERWATFRIMRNRRNALPPTVRLLVLFAGVAALAWSANAPRALAATTVPLEKLSLSERLSSAPDSTPIQFGPRATTLGILRAAHRAREAALSKAASLGAGLRGKLVPIQGGAAIANTGPRLNGVNAGNLQVAPQAFIEPSSQYASAPADMKAFCGAAQASACLYLPPNQQVTAEQSGVADWDSLVTQTQCAQEGGTWSSIWNGTFCAFNYPASVVVHFTPAANFKLARSASCDHGTFTYDIDVHGAITITLAGAVPAIVTTDDNPTCIVSVIPGG